MTFRSYDLCGSLSTGGQAMSQPISVVMPVYDRVTQLDFTGPHQFLSRTPDLDVRVASLGGRSITTDRLTFSNLEDLAAIESCDVLLVPGGGGCLGRIVRDGNILSGGGVTAGIDFVLALIAELCGRRAAEMVQLSLEYAPQPPFNSGRPDTAPAEVLEAVNARIGPSRAQRRARLDAWAAARHA